MEVWRISCTQRSSPLWMERTTSSNTWGTRMTTMRWDGDQKGFYPRGKKWPRVIIIILFFLSSKKENFPEKNVFCETHVNMWKTNSCVIKVCMYIFWHCFRHEKKILLTIHFPTCCHTFLFFQGKLKKKKKLCKKETKKTFNFFVFSLLSFIHFKIFWLIENTLRIFYH